MRTIAILLCVTNMGLVHAQRIRFKVQFSEPLAVFEFVSHITPHAGPHPYRKAFDGSKYDTEEHRALLERFERADHVYWYEYPQYPYGNKVGGSTYFLLHRNLIESSSIDEFASRSLGVVPNADLAVLKSVLEVFVPIYRELVFNPNEKALRTQIELLERKIGETDVDGIVQRISHFHGSSWDTSTPFVLSICPTGESSSIHATAFFNHAFTNLPCNQMNMDLVLSFMFHEAFHIIYDEQPLELKLELAGWFRNDPSKCAKYAELLFNEAITTALSSGYLWNHLSDTPLPEEKWYNNTFIAAMAVKIHPLTVQYLDSGRPVDKAFVQEYIRLYASSFPHWMTDVENLMGDRFILCGNEETRRSIEQEYPFRNIRETGDVLDGRTLERMKALPITKLIVLSPDGGVGLELIERTFPELKDLRPDMDADFAHAIFLADKTYLIIVNAVTRPAAELLRETRF